MFTITRLYEQVNDLHPIDRQTFDDLLPNVILDLCSFCGRKYLLCEKEGPDSLPVREEYYTALLSGVLYAVRGDLVDKERFFERAENAKNAIWRQMAEVNRKGGAQ